jgi:hypothetical protein
LAHHDAGGCKPSMVGFGKSLVTSRMNNLNYPSIYTTLLFC